MQESKSCALPLGDSPKFKKSLFFKRNFGKRLPFYIAAISKDRASDGIYHPRVAVIEVSQQMMDERLIEFKKNVRKIHLIKTGEIVPIACGVCVPASVLA